MAEIFQNREQIIEHVGIYIAEHRKQFSCIAGALQHPIAGVEHRSVWLGLYLHATLCDAFSNMLVISLPILEYLSSILFWLFQQYFSKMMKFNSQLSISDYHRNDEHRRRL